jgi:hypothetical protein
MPDTPTIFCYPPIPHVLLAFQIAETGSYFFFQKKTPAAIVRLIFYFILIPVSLTLSSSSSLHSPCATPLSDAKRVLRSYMRVAFAARYVAGVLLLILSFLI